MKAIRVHSFGGPEVLRYEDVAEPTPKPGEVVVKIDAAGLNLAEVGFCGFSSGAGDLTSATAGAGGSGCGLGIESGAGVSVFAADRGVWNTWAHLPHLTFAPRNCSCTWQTLLQCGHSTRTAKAAFSKEVPRKVIPAR